MKNVYLTSFLCCGLMCQGCLSQQTASTPHDWPKRPTYEKASSPWSRSKGEETVEEAAAKQRHTGIPPVKRK